MPAIQRFREIFWIALLPVSLLWAMVTGLRRRFYPRRWKYHSRLQVICVGNLHSGGSGKTPLTMEIVDYFSGRQPIILSRGYRGQLSRSGARVDRGAADGAELFGDEPWMLAQRWNGPVYVGRHRTRALKKIEAEFSTGLVVLDDGFQHLAVARQVDLALIHAGRRPSAAFCLPLGDLREPLIALRHASAIVLIEGENQTEWKEVVRDLAPGVVVFPARLRSQGIWDGGIPYQAKAGETGAGFCGIAHPQDFQRTLSSVPGATFVRGYGDHHSYSDRDLDELMRTKESKGLDYFLTTDKDWFKVNERLTRRGARVFSLRIRYEMPPEFWYFLENRLETRDR